MKSAESGLATTAASVGPQMNDAYLKSKNDHDAKADGKKADAEAAWNKAKGKR